jgi:glucosamine kinase
MEGMAPMTPLAEEVLAFFDGNPEAVVQWARKAEPADYGRFAPSVFAYAERGDGLAVPIVETTAVDISRLVSRLVEVGAGKVAMIGGIWPGIMRWLQAEIRSHLIEPAGDGAHGGVLMARRASARVEG